MPTLSVSNSTQLRSALSAAKPGDTILLASGNYGSFAFNDLKYSGYVTVRSADPGRPATFTDIDVHNSSYLRIDRVHVSNPTSGSAASKVVDIDRGSHHVEFLNSEVNGTGGGGSNYANYQGHYGIYTGSASNVRVQGNHVHDVKNGIVSIGTTNLQHVGNRIDYIGNDSFKLAGIRNVLIEDNTGASHVYPEPGAHLDFIQFQGSDSSDIVIRGNVYLGGTMAWVQGIFLDDAFYRNVLIENNVIYTGQANGILVTAGSGVVTRYNTVLNNPGDGHKATTIRLPAGSVSQNNITGGEQGSLGGSDIRIQYTDPRAANYYNKVYADAMEGIGLTIADLRPVAGGLATTKGAYARILEILNGGPAPVPTPVPAPAPDPDPTPGPDPDPAPGSPIDSDDFSAATLRGFWAFEGPAGTSARLGAGGGNEYLELRVPDGNFDIYRTTKKAARLMQDAPDSDFQVETRFLTNPTTKNQSQGILVEQDGDSWIRFDTYFNGSDLKAFAAVTLDGATTNKINLTIAGDVAPYLKVIHRGDAWTFAWSADGEVWKTAGSFTQKLDVNAIGPFASGVDLPYTARVDYFENLAAPIANEDGAGSRSGAAAPAAAANGLRPRRRDELRRRGRRRGQPRASRGARDRPGRDRLQLRGRPDRPQAGAGLQGRPRPRQRLRGLDRGRGAEGQGAERGRRRLVPHRRRRGRRARRARHLRRAGGAALGRRQARRRQGVRPRPLGERGGADDRRPRRRGAAVRRLDLGPDDLRPRRHAGRSRPDLSPGRPVDSRPAAPISRSRPQGLAMKHDLGRLTRWLGLVPDHVRFRGAVLPPARMRYCGAAFRDDATFLDSGLAEAKRLVADFGIGPATRMLEIGCGPGRLPIGLIAAQVAVGRYDGVDIDARAIRWCRQAHHREAPRVPLPSRRGPPPALQPRGPADGRGLPPAVPGTANSTSSTCTRSSPTSSPTTSASTPGSSSGCSSPGGRSSSPPSSRRGCRRSRSIPRTTSWRSPGRCTWRATRRTSSSACSRRRGSRSTRFGHRADLGGQSVVHLKRPA